MTTNVDTIISPRWIVTMTGDGALTDHSVVVDGPKIVAVLPTAEASARYTANETLELANHALLPGFVNAHTHAAMSLLRGYADDLPLDPWLNDHIWPAEARWVGAEYVRDGTRLAAAEMLRGGTTCFSDMYFFPDETARAAEDIGIRAVVGLIVIDFPTAWAANADEYLAKATALHDELRHHPTVHTAFAPHAPYTVSDAPLERIAVLAEELDVPVHIHVHETRGEVENSVTANGCRPLARLDALGLVSNRLVAVHCTQLDAAEIDLLATRGASVVHCPESNLKLASGFCRSADLLSAGVNLALGTDGCASNNDLDMFGEMRTAALLAKGVSGDPSAMPAMRALEAATIGGARALGLDALIGSVEAGKSADLCAVELDSIETVPHYDVVSQLVYATSRNHVSDVWVAGRRALRARALTGADERVIMSRSQDWADRIRTGAAQGSDDDR